MAMLYFYWSKGEGHVAGHPRLGQTRLSTVMPQTRSLGESKKTRAAAKLQIYWSGNKYKYLIKKLLWKDLYTTVSCLYSAAPALTPDLSAQGRGKPLRGRWQVN